MAGKQTKVFSEDQLREVVIYVERHNKYSLRNRVILLFPHKAGLRAKEIAALRWSMVTDGKGHLLDVLSLPDSATKGNSGRTIPLHHQLHAALAFLMKEQQPQQSDPIIRSAHKGPRTAASVADWFGYLYRSRGFNGCSRHSGPRTFITNIAHSSKNFRGRWEFT